MPVNTLLMSNFNYCSLVRNFPSVQSLNEIKMLHKRALRFLQNDYVSTYEDLLEKSRSLNLKLRRQRTLICKTLHCIKYASIRVFNDLYSPV